MALVYELGVGVVDKGQGCQQPRDIVIIYSYYVEECVLHFNPSQSPLKQKLFKLEMTS